MTDEEAIAFAMLVDCTPWLWNNVGALREVWYVRDRHSPILDHNIERWWAGQHDRSRGGEWFFRSQAEAARAVCEYFKLGDFKDDTK